MPGATVPTRSVGAAEPLRLASFRRPEKWHNTHAEYLFIITEADACRKYVLPKLVAAGWDSDPQSLTEQKTFTDGRIVPTGSKVFRSKTPQESWIPQQMLD